MYRTNEFVALAVRRISRSNWVTLNCLKATADFYGWSAVFPTIWDAKSVDYPGNIRPWPSKVNGRNHRGVRLRISRSKVTKSGQPAGLTNCFRVSNNCSTFDLIAIAQAVGVDYGWMEDKAFHRVEKARWDAHDLPDRYCQFDLRAADC